MSNLPEYLKQSDKELVHKFKYIQYQEDQRLRDATVNPDTSRWSLGKSVLKSNSSRNRYVNIMPYDRNRVKLNVIRGNDYINASYVKLNVRNQSINPGYYIATQGPTSNTWQQFWQMCYSSCPFENIVIVMVTPLNENGREKCYQYWPMGEKYGDSNRKISKIQTPGGPDDVSEFPNELEVEFVKAKRVNGDYVITTLNLKPIGENSYGKPIKTIHHFYFDQWKDMSRPEEVVPIMHLCQHSHSLNSNENPIIVHCSAGVGRSGTFIALDHLLHDTNDFKIVPTAGSGSGGIRIPMQHYDHDLVEQVVMQLRIQRLKMVQMVEQFAFIYHAARYLYEIVSS
ncbi:hypothetical protein TBLA_0B00300 [Henningerozyma blattae CBS 6284]|uniref:protein-tyrosine-phosphatase n=1 Tax=Henningerozyma blattae (strain ATCC 34711 / CBS 6284 / DSM 70876 / NBRC 10599 / NRRL Y-10934 / UCD 77-7) TaxID=1071380 RepID=I2GXM3_HENB6|nr:hypothetical protein TBLA_0B00300 [Tetrapisispora blattae CBS 6284]CCH58875.1 hypothetical protein TBLA_0B00300 [Tetrapisispora blattae CBS 6284]